MDNDFLHVPGFNRRLRPAGVAFARNTFLAYLSGHGYPRFGKRDDLAQNGQNVV